MFRNPDRAAPPSFSVIIDGQPRQGSVAILPHIYPATGQVTREVRLADASDVDAAVAAARVAAPAWRAMTGHKRRDLFFKLAALCEANMAQLSALVTAEKGSICMAAPFMAIDAAQKFRYFGGWADKIQGRTINTWGGPAHDYIAQEPYGVVGAIIPWNGPLFAVTMVIAQALAAGSTLVIKSPETAPWSLIRASTKFSLSVVVQPRRRF